MTWVNFVLPVAVTLGILAVLGLPAALALRLRGFALPLITIPAGLAVIAMASIIGGLLGLSWNLVFPLVLALSLAALLFFLRRWIVPHSITHNRPHRFWTPVGAAAIGGLAISVALILSLKSADAISQTYDANFHLNAVRLILDSGAASPFDMDLASPGAAAFYPTLWHALVALVVQLSGAGIPMATNAVLFVIAAVVWPIGAVAFGRAVAGPSRRTTVIAGIFSAAFPSFPLVLTGYGVLYPNLISTALIPFVLVAFLQLVGLGPARRSDPLTTPVRWLLLFGALGAAALAHPNAVHATLLWIAIPTVWALVRHAKGWRTAASDGSFHLPTSPPRVRVALATLGLIVLGGMIGAAWYMGRTGDNPWEGARDPLGALVDLVGGTPRLEGHAWPLALLILIGAILVWRQSEMRWLLGSAAVLGVFFVVANGFPASDWRTLLLSPWYNDPWRLATLVSFGGFPLAVIGGSAFAAVCILGFRVAARKISATPGRTFTQFTVVGALFLLAATQGAGAHAGIQYVSGKYEFHESSALLSPDERTLIERLPEHVPPDAILVNNPWNGGALAYAVTGIEVMTPHTGGTYDSRITDMTAWLDFGAPESCAAAKELNAQFVLDFGTRYVFGNTPRALPYAGISGVASESSSTLTEVDREGDAVLYEITGC